MNDKQFPLVSVAVITYNQKEFLRECIESILEQNYPNFEIVVADDASADGTQDMLREYDNKYPGKFVLKLASKNQGITANSNQAHFSCKGKYVAWMGGDDLMLPGRISEQADYLEKHPSCNIVYSNSEVFLSDSNRVIGYSSELSPVIVGGKQEDMVRLGCFVGGCTAMVRRSSSPLHGFDTRIPIASDWKYWIDSLSDGGTVDYLDGLLSRHRRHKNNVTNNDRNNFNIKNHQDSLITCAITLSQYPNYRRAVFESESRIYRSMRHYQNGYHYRNYLKLSLSKKFNIKSLVAYILSFSGKLI